MKYTHGTVRQSFLYSEINELRLTVRNAWSWMILRSVYSCYLGRLIELRLIEKVSQILLPLEMSHDSYQLTHLGHQVPCKYYLAE